MIDYILEKNRKRFYIFIALGLIVMGISLFHENLWFDEAYSVGLARYSIQDIIQIDSHDVHPPLYYVILHFIGICTNDSILAYRLFSYACIVIAIVWGYQLIKRIYDRTHADYFIFFIVFTPIFIVYSSEIRMYTLVGALVAISCLYAILICKNNDLKDWVIFSVLNLIIAYTHYYGLLAIALSNIYLLIYYIRRKDMKRWLVFALIQIGLYMPWLMVLFAQMGAVRDNFWLSFVFPNSIIEMVTFQFSGDLEGSSYLPKIAVIVYEVYICFIGVKYFRKQDHQLYTIGVYGGVILSAIIASLLMRRDIFYARYLLVISFVFVIWFSKQIVHIPNIHKNIIIVIHVISSIFASVQLSLEHYDSSNIEPYTYLDTMLEENDVILVRNANHDPNSFIALSKYENTVIYYNEMTWSDESVAAYKAFSQDMYVIDSLDDLPVIDGRICVIYADDDDIGIFDNQDIVEAVDGVLQSHSYFQTRYKNIEYTIDFISY